MDRLVLYIHGKGGSVAESGHYAPLFPGCEVRGLDYRADTPWEAGGEIRAAVQAAAAQGQSVTLIANSIGAFFSMHAGVGGMVERAYFISPVIDMEGLIRGMMAGAGVTEAELQARGEIPAAGGETLSWEYLQYVRTHPLRWEGPAEILWGGRDALTSREAVTAFAAACGAGLTVMEEGGHWFHTPEELRFLDAWIRGAEQAWPFRIRSERLSPEAYVDFLRHTDLGSQYPKERFAERIPRLLENASISLTARSRDGRLAGVLLGLTDFAYWLYVTDLGVDRDFVRQGIGRALMRAALEAAGGEKDIAVYLIANEQAVPFYEKLGMKRADEVMKYNHIEWTEFTVE